MRILVADDSPAVAYRVADLLSDVEGIEVAGRAGAVRETSRLIDELHPEILILDLQLPDGSGFHVLEAIKRSHPNSMVIVLTNSAAPPVREKCLKAGADFFLDKSNEFESLPQIVRTIVRGFRAASTPVLSSPQNPEGQTLL
jgi:DNA-binding NarL/FixJ family response regulator